MTKTTLVIPIQTVSIISCFSFVCMCNPGTSSVQHSVARQIFAFAAFITSDFGEMPFDLFNLVHGRETSNSSHEVNCDRDDKSFSPLPHIKYKEFGLLFLVDNGAKISLVNPLPHERRNL